MSDKKYWDIKPKKTTKRRKHIPIYPVRNPIGPIVIAPHPDICGPMDIPCLHDQCPGCKSGLCSGIHMISCPCPKCSPRMGITMSIDDFNKEFTPGSGIELVGVNNVTVIDVGY